MFHRASYCNMDGQLSVLLPNVLYRDAKHQPEMLVLDVGFANQVRRWSKCDCIFLEKLYNLVTNFT